MAEENVVAAPPPIEETDRAEKTEKKKWVKTYQPKDDYGNPIGPPQYFEAETKDELIEKLAKAHENASAALYKTKRAAKLGALIEPDIDEPIPSFEEKPLTADELSRIDELLKDPTTTPEAVKILIEAQLGAPLDIVRKTLRDAEIEKRAAYGREQVQLFLQKHPEYVACDANREAIEKWLLKRNLALTLKNLELAYEDLLSDGILIVQPPKRDEKSSPTETKSVAPLSSGPEITVSATTQPAITGGDEERPTPKLSSSGLSREHGMNRSAPKVKGITKQDIARLTADEYAKKLRDPEFRKQVEALYSE